MIDGTCRIPISDQGYSSTGHAHLNPQSRHRPISFIPEQLSPDYCTFPACSLSAARPDLIASYFRLLPGGLFYFANPSTTPGQCVGLRFAGGEKHLTSKPLVDFGSNCHIMTEAEATRLHIPVYPFAIQLGTSAGSSSIKGVTLPIDISYGTPPNEIITQHCFLVVTTTVGCSYTILFGNPDAITHDAIHDVTAKTLLMRPKTLGQPNLIFPLETRFNSK